MKPMKDPLGVSPSKGDQGTTQGKEKNSFDLGGNRTHNLWVRSTVTLLTSPEVFKVLRGTTFMNMYQRYDCICTWFQDVSRKKLEEIKKAWEML